MQRWLSIAIAALIFAAAVTRADELVRIAGGGKKSADAPATDIELKHPFGIDFDKQGNMYIVELYGDRAHKVDPKGYLTRLGGTGKKGNTGDGGPVSRATFNAMHAVAVHHPSGKVYVADTLNHRVRCIDPKTGIITGFAGGKRGFSGDGGPASKAEFNGIFCIAISPDGSKMIVTDLGNRRLREIDMATGKVKTVAGNGERGVPKDGSEAVSVPLVDPRAACYDSKGNIYLLERGGNALRVIRPDGKIYTLAGTGKAGLSGDGGPALQAKLRGPKHLCVDLEGNVIIADTANHVIRRYEPDTKKIFRVAGTGKKGPSGDGGDPLKIMMNEPHGVYVSPAGVLYIVDSYNHRVFRLQK